MKKSFRMLIVAASLGFVTLVPVMALAQEQPANNMEIVREKLRADKKLLVAEAMGMTESEAKTFWPLYAAYQKDLIKLGDREIAVIQEYAKVYQSMTNEEARKLMDEWLAIETDFHKTRMDYVPKFRGMLSDIKVARYFQIENKIMALVDFELAEKIPLIDAPAKDAPAKEQ